MAELTELPVQSWGLFQPADAREPPTAPTPDATWVLNGGTAWVYYSPLNRKLLKPVILSDGFETGPSKLNVLWDGLEEGGVYGSTAPNKKEIAFITELRNRGHDLIILGYNERSASILDNAEAAIACIRKAIAERTGDYPLMVGGFSMGGLVTRYALAKMEAMSMDHQTAMYLSYDSPHRGAWVPIAMQALAHSLGAASGMSKQINSPACRQLLVRHIATVEAPPEVKPDPLRIDFLKRLESFGSWPSRPRKIGVANGSDTGIDNGVPAGAVALECTKGPLVLTKLWTQAAGDNVLVAIVNNPLIVRKEVRTSRLLDFDGASGGMLGTFGIAAHHINQFSADSAVCNHREICFVPAVSAVAIRDIDTRDNLYADISTLSPDDSDLDEFICASKNQEHTRMTKELGTWILERLP